MELIARRFDSGQLVRIQIQGDRIGQVEPIKPRSEPEGGWPWVAPGLVDLQVNGYGGQEFSSPDLTVEKVRQIALAMDRFGVVRFCPTITTNSPEVIEHALRTIAQACRQLPEVGQRVAGIHLEGPYISPQDGARGAHPLAHCRAPNWQEFQRFQAAAEGRVRLLTLSPEYEGAEEFIRRVSASGVVVSIGHTAASPEQIHRAADAGARMSTHLGNGCHPVLPRHRNYLWAQLADDRLTAGLIGDGFHLPPDVLKCLLRAKGPERCVLVSDLSGMAGLPPGRYTSNLCELEILPTGKMVIAGQQELLAGATLPVGEGVANGMRFAGLELGQAIRLATERPLEVLGLEWTGLAAGTRADLVVFALHLSTGKDKQNTQNKENKQTTETVSARQETKILPIPLQFRVLATILGGELVFGEIP
jgi:N-acetylglucosamine-6-phosphate deacetylase